jgi:3-oxosteroid 1-dehydrogenase
VLIVEKSEYFGGSTALSGGGFWIPGNALLQRAGVIDSPERAREYLRAVTAGETPESRWETHIVHGPAAVDVLRRRTPPVAARRPPGCSRACGRRGSRSGSSRR